MSLVLIVTIRLLIIIVLPFYSVVGVLLRLNLELLDVFFGQLSDVFAFLPNAHAWHPVFARSQHTSTMLLTIEPLTSVDTTIGPLESALTFFDIVDEVTFILASIWPDK